LEGVIVNLVFEGFGSCGDLVGLVVFNSVFERDACDDFGEIVQSRVVSPSLLRALTSLNISICSIPIGVTAQPLEARGCDCRIVGQKGGSTDCWCEFTLPNAGAGKSKECHELFAVFLQAEHRLGIYLGS